MAGEAIKRIDANMEAALGRSIRRFKESLSVAYDRMVGSKPVPLEERGQEYLTLAGDLPALKQWFEGQAAIHGKPIARTMLIQFAKDGERYIDKLMVGAKQDAKDVDPSV